MVKKVIATVKEGKVCGIKTTSSFSGVEYNAFYGIPYGQPTHGSKRFKDPVKVKPWKNVYDATTQKDGCLQFALSVSKITGSEDCLYNNIYSPKLPSKDDPLKPVIVCIHPGGYFHGSPDPWYYGSPDYVINHDFVYVCVGYRLHILGFLNLGLEECSGNQGLKDIILSLEWIKENISVFGGDPDNVTLLGSSSGSSIVHFLMLSPAAKGLFHKAIMMGIYVFDPTLLFKEEQVTTAFKLARAIGYEDDSDDKKKLLKFLKNVNIHDIVVTKPEKNTLQDKVAIFPSSPFMPSVDSGKNAVLPESFRELMATTSRIPLMVGICDKEGAMALTRPMKAATLENFDTAYLQNCWGWGRGISKTEVDVINERIRLFYCNGKPVEKASMNTQIDILTDIAFSDIYDTLIDLVSSDHQTPVFVYKFEFEGNACTMKDRLRILLEEHLEGTCHAADFSYWALVENHWGVKTPPLNAESVEMVKTFTKLIATFAATGDPNYNGLSVIWKPSIPENPRYLSINDPLQEVDGKLNGERMKFWEDLKKKFRKN